MPKVGMTDIRKEQIIQATKDCIVRKGLFNLSMKDITKEAGVSTGVVYHYFKNKEDILLHVLKESFRQSHEQVMRNVEPVQPPEKKLERHLESINAVPRDNPEFYIVLLNYLGEAKYNPEIRKIVAKFFNNLKDYVKGYLGEDAEDGHEKNLPVMVYALGLGLGIMWTTDNSLYDIDEMEESVKKFILQFLYREKGDIPN